MQSQSLYQYIFRNSNFVWKYDHDLLMCREVLDIEPYQFKVRSPERGKAKKKRRPFMVSNDAMYATSSHSHQAIVVVVVQVDLMFFPPKHTSSLQSSRDR